MSEILTTKKQSGAFSPANGGLPPGYERTLHRLESLAEVPREVRDRAWKQLIAWQAGQRLLPAPYVFANDHLHVEFEWETARADLMLRLLPEERFEYLLTTRDQGAETDREGIVDGLGAAELLAQLAD